MPDNKLAGPGGIAAAHQDLGADEKAILSAQRIPALRSLFTRLWRVKLSLQFTGWLQYIPSAMLALACFLIAGLVHLLGGARAANLFYLVGILLLALLIFDLATVKFRLRPRERLPERNDNLDVFDLMRARRSCRSFQTRKLTPAAYGELMEHVCTRSKGPTIGTAPVRFEYVSAPLSVWPTVNATEFLVAIAPLQYDRLAVLDVGRTLQKIVIDATRMGLATCWIGPGADHASIMQHLGARFRPEEDHIICVCAVGYKSWFIPVFLRIFNAQFRRRLPIGKLFYVDPQLREPINVNAYPFNRFGRNYEVCQWAPSSYNGQTTRCAAVMERNGRGREPYREQLPHLARFDFYSTTESRYYAPVAAGVWCANWEMGCEALGIPGHFVVLSPEERAGKDEPARLSPPLYNVSWKLDFASDFR